ncbi:hypothetical protein BDQ12DRAFT_720322 [Crucibulum laeve]|uniref:Uncharacterized protein n=1 Tax=Crucibulum laeve TaxID=68775 RepID=A0A5C3M855_9AGAR|nr:hypothetical protein BDQ12DRAFT_720322 [Crucibulum laeve]
MSRSSKKKNEKMDWMKVTEETVLHGDASKLSMYTHYQIYHPITSTCSAIINELLTLAMVLQGAASIISSIACSHSKAKVSEKLVLVELNVAGAIDHLTMASINVKGNDGHLYLLLEVLECFLVQKHVKEYLGGLFIKSVNPTREDGEEKNNNNEICRTINAAKKLRGTVNELG